MNVRITHDGSTITSHVIRYDREHKICTGIGMLEMEVDYSYGATFNPWDVVNIYEGGSLKGKYFVSTVSEGQPNATITVTCQDNSKRLSDYFITDSYLIDYPSYTRYWIETFLKEVGISYKFTTESMGNLLSNNTALGLMSAYEQVIMLLQMSGWYITFDAGGSATIGKLEVSSAKPAGSFANKDIIEIKVDKNDRMYRNRVVVWGNGDPETDRWVFADVSKPTKWDYDKRDKRTILISNSNIPSVKSAFMIANQALTEFARLNIEKYITVTGSRNVSVGNAVSIKTKVFTGRGLVTTLGSSMSKEGLVTKIALDERCPRLFGFFNYGGFVYVGTFGSGVWRNHLVTYSGAGSASGIMPSGYASGVIPSGWQDYSTGLTDMNITDLHVNGGILASVGSSGSMFYSIEADEVWSGIMLSGLQVAYSGVLVEPTIYSGLMARACIIDRDTNMLRYAVDTRSGINYGDFLYETDTVNNTIFTMFTYGSGGAGSGTAGSGYRSWVIDANPYDGSITDTYSVTVSGNYNFIVLDIENDGSYDYVEAMTLQSGYIPSYLTNGFHTNSTFGNAYYDIAEYHPNMQNLMAYSGLLTPEMQVQEVAVMGGQGFDSVFSMYDYTPDGDAYVSYAITTTSYIDFVVKKATVTASGNLIDTSYTKREAISSSLASTLYTERTDVSNYVYYILNPAKTSVTKYTYNINSNSVTTGGSIGHPWSGGRAITVGHMYYYLTINLVGSGFDAVLGSIDFRSGATSTSTIVSKSGTGTLSGQYSYSANIFKMMPYGANNVAIDIPYIKRTWIDDYGINATYTSDFYMHSIKGVGEAEYDYHFYDWNANHGVSRVSSFLQYGDILSDSDALASGISGNFTSSNTYYRFVYGGGQTGGATRQIATSFGNTVDLTNPLNGCIKIYNVGASSTPPVAKIGTVSVYTFKAIDPSDGSQLYTIPNPVGYRLIDLAGIDSYNGDFLFIASTHVSSNDLAYLELVSIPAGGSSTVTRRGTVASGAASEFIVGNFRISVSGSSSVYYFVKPSNILGIFPMYLVLQRDGWDYSVIKSGVYRDRLDISNYSPLVTMGRGISSMETYFIASDESVLQTTHIGISGYNIGSGQTSGSMFTLGINAEDFRYSDFEDVTESGTSRKILIVYSGGVGSIDIMGESSNFSGAFLSPSGYANRIEISNFYLPDQYVFISVSGYSSVSGVQSDEGWGFFMKPPASGIYSSGIYSESGYNPYSGLMTDCSEGYPQARTTIIRLDDSL